MNVTIRCLGLVILAAKLNQAQSSTARGLGWLMTQADLALVGTVTNHTVSGNRLQFVVAADQVLKGGGPGTYTVTASSLTPSQARFYQAAAASGRLPRPRALILARKVGPEWELVGPSYREFRMEHFVFELPPQYVAPARRSSDTVEDSTVRIFAAHIAALPKQRTVFGYPQSALISYARDTRGKPGAALRETVDGFLSSPNQDLLLLGIQMKVALNDLSTPALVESAQQSLDQARGALALNEFRNWYRSEDVLSVRSVVKVLNNTRNERLKEACVWTLHRAHVRASLPTLAAALDSPNAKIRYMAVRGLAGFAKNMTYDMETNNPGPWRYRTEETEKRSRGTDEQLAGADSVQFWRSWWEKYKNELIEE